MNFIVALDESETGGPPTAQTAPKWAASVKAMGYLVGSDMTGQILQMTTTYDEMARPGKCALAPDMTILKCWLGKTNTPGLDAIKVHAAAHPNGM